MNSSLAGIHEWVDERPLIIAGPCSAESEDQLLGAARALSRMRVKVFRAGIWKPRTRPGMFEGVGSIGLRWLQQVKKETGMMTATEVITAKHVYEAIKYGVDILWIGARTTVNPYAVQEIAEAAAGVDVPVLLKNPIGPDVDLWMGGLERLIAAGITKIGVIHRGFSDVQEKFYRNAPHWNIAIELKKRVPDIPMIGDPSHMAGKRELIPELARKSLDLGFDGLMIEVHCHPERALSDARQQVTPDAFRQIIRELRILQTDSIDPVADQELRNIRKAIDRYDDALVALLDKRMVLAERVGMVKKKYNLAAVQSARWEEILRKKIVQCGALGLSERFAAAIFEAIHGESVHRQLKIMHAEK